MPDAALASQAAQTMQAVADPLIALVGTGLNVGAFSLVAWLLKRTFGHTIPRISADFKESLATQRGEFLAAIDTQREQFMHALEKIEQRAVDERRECLVKVEELRREVIVLGEAVRQDMVRTRDTRRI